MDDKVQSIMALKPCPFCGNETPEFERMGTPRQSCVVRCGNCGALHESGDEGEFSGTSWNERAAIREAIAAPGVEQGWKVMHVESKSWGEFIDAMDRAERKGYLPDAVVDEWLQLDYRDPAAHSPTAEQPVTIKGGNE